MGDQWSAMPPEILELISDRLSLAGFFTFRSVCRSWRSAPSGRLDISKFKKDSTWLMFYDVSGGDDDDGKDGHCYLYSTSHPTPCTFQLPGLKGATIVESKLGWFLAHHDGNLFFFNPFSLEKIEVAHCPLAPDQFYTFSRPPTSPRCIVYVLRCTNDGGRFEMCHRRIKDANWSIKHSFSVNEEYGIGRTVVDFSSCCCAMDYPWSRCTCGCHDKIVFTLYGPGGERNYHYYCRSSKICGNIGVYDSGDRPDPAMDPFGVMEATHGNNWLKEFGGVQVSIASHGCNPPAGIVNVVGSIAMTRSVKIDGDLRGTRKVKATWIEPWFALKHLTETHVYHRGDFQSSSHDSRYGCFSSCFTACFRSPFY